jgi:hypothetical protein
MSLRKWLSFLLVITLGISVSAQKIIYSDPGKDDTRNMNFEIAGKINGNFLIYKNNRGHSWITVLDNDMKDLTNNELDFVPNNDRLINTDFFPYADFCFMIYQYQKKNVLYCAAAKLDGMGNKVGEVMDLDTTHIGFAANNKIHSVLTSEDKSKIAVFKINSKNKRLYILTTYLYSDKLELLKKSRLEIPMEDRNEYISDFQLDNEGDLVFAKFYRNSNDNITSGSLMIKPAFGDEIVSHELNIEKTWLDELHIKVDNANHRYILTSFYYKERRGNIDGYYFFIWNKTTSEPVLQTTATFTDELRKEAKGDAGMKSAFNDYFIRHIIIRKDGGFLLGTEAYYTTSRFNNWSRWDYLYGSPYYGSYNDYYYPGSFRYFGMNSSNRFTNQAVRYHADNIAVFSFNSKGEMEWSNVMGKTQFDDQSDDMLSYQLMNTGGQLHFLFNFQERKNNLLTDFSVTADGQLSRNPTLKNLDKGYDFFPKYAKQVGSRQMIIPCGYRNYLCFAKLEYN